MTGRSAFNTPRRRALLQLALAAALLMLIVLVQQSSQRQLFPGCTCLVPAPGPPPAPVVVAAAVAPAAAPESGEAMLATGTRTQRAIVSLSLPVEGKDERKYASCLLLMIHTLRNVGWQDDIVVLVTNTTHAEDVANVRATGAEVLLVERMTSNSAGDPSFKAMFTKLHVWSLTQYEQIAYYDGDHVFLRNPSEAFEACGAAAFCATGDSGLQSDLSKATYFNAGFIVLRPSASVYQFLLDRQHLGEGKRFAEQDLLNELFDHAWRHLDERFNRMIPNVRGIPPDTVAVHDKIWNLRKDFPDSKWVWNTWTGDKN